MRVQNIRFEPSEPVAEAPSTTLKFDLINDGVESLTDIILKVSVLDGNDTRPDVRRTVLAGPFTIRGSAPLHPGFTMTYEVRLRNLAECTCVGNVDIISVRGSTGSEFPR